MMPCPQLGAILGVDWLDEFDNNEKMFAGRDRIHAMLEQHFRSAPLAHWLELLDAHDVWCAPVQDYRRLEQDPHLAHSGLLWDVPIGESTEGTSFRTVGSPFFFSRTPPRLRRGVPRSGQHTDEILGGAK